MTPRELLQQVDIDRSEAELLLAGLLEVDRGWLIAHADEALDEQRVDLFLTHANARASGEPLAYVLGYRDFWTLRLAVNQHVLIPRRETEHLVEWAIECIDSGAHTALDLGTGSGAIALACKSERPATQVTGVDLSSEALLCAKKNSRSLDLDVEWRLGDWFQAVPGMRWDVIMSNPPYIAADDVHLTEAICRQNPIRLWWEGRQVWKRLSKSSSRRLKRSIERGGCSLSTGTTKPRPWWVCSDRVVLSVSKHGKTGRIRLVSRGDNG